MCSSLCLYGYNKGYLAVEGIMRSKFRAIETQEQRPMGVILKELYAKHGNQTRVARELGVSQGTVSGWLKQLGYQEWTTLVPRKQEPQE